MRHSGAGSIEGPCFQVDEISRSTLGAFLSLATSNFTTTSRNMASPTKKLVVCGGNGFLGSRICKYAVARGWDVTSIRYVEHFGHLSLVVPEVWRHSSQLNSSATQNKVVDAKVKPDSHNSLGLTITIVVLASHNGLL